MLKYLISIFFLVVMLFAFGCKDRSDQPNTLNNESSLFTSLDSAFTNIDFVNTITETEQFNFLIYEYLHNGGGVSLGDINNDGLIDIYFTGNMVYNKLYLNLGNFKFKDITQTAGVNGGLGFKTGVTMSDVNGDGWLDIYICKSAIEDPVYRKNVLYINNGDLTFSDKSAEFGLDDPSYSTQAYFFDMDEDGDQDMYLVNHPFNLRESNNINVEKDQDGNLKVAKPSNYTYISDRLYRNDSNKFKDISKEANILNEAFGLSAAVGDFNGDHKLDIYVCNDYIKPDHMYMNQGNGKFVDEFDKYFAHSSFSSMGSDLGDINNDGCLDLMTLDMVPRDHFRQNMLGMAQNYDKFNKLVDLDLKAQYSINALQLNNCNGRFSDIAFMANVAMTDWSWSSLLADFDNDGLKDIFVSNGYVRDVTNNDYTRYTMDSLQKELNLERITVMDWLKAIPKNEIPSYFFKNNGDLTFKDVSSDWNSGGPAFSSGAAYADLDNDGFLDVVVSNIDASPFILKNDGKKKSANHFISLDLKSKGQRSVVGIIAYAKLSDGTILTEHLSPTRGFLSSSQPRVHFGIPKDKSVISIEIVWAKGKSQIISQPELNKILTIEENTSKTEPKPEVHPFFSKLLPNNKIKHAENTYIDFKREPLLHHKYSEEGPAAAVGDINGDGLDDFFLGGAMGFSAQIYLQQKSGQFIQVNSKDVESDKAYEDVSAVLFDADGDKDLDLYVASGGNEMPANDPFYEDRLYLNDGKGNFTKQIDKLPKIYSSNGVVKCSDIDNDGDLDLLVGARVTPGRCPELPESYFLKNENGHFSLATDTWAPKGKMTGMMTDAVFADIDKDGTNELIYCGEWMPVTVLKWNGKSYDDITTDMGLNEMTGWWYSLNVTDVNGDGYPEIIVGNLGLNAQLKASKDKPASMVYSDFDKNGTIDPVLCFYNQDESYPLQFRDRMLDQMIFLKKKFTRYHQYGQASINDIFDKQQLKNAKQLFCNTFEHHILLNQEGKKFLPKKLPNYAQISVVKSILAIDVNGDGQKEILLNGNFYGTDAQIGRYDASIGCILELDKNDNFNVISPLTSGWNASGNVRHVLPFNESSFWIIRNNGMSSFLKLN